MNLYTQGQPGLQTEFQDSQSYTGKPCLENENKHQQKESLVSC